MRSVHRSVFKYISNPRNHLKYSIYRIRSNYRNSNLFSCGLLSVRCREGHRVRAGLRTGGGPGEGRRVIGGWTLGELCSAWEAWGTESEWEIVGIGPINKEGQGRTCSYLLIEDHIGDGCSKIWIKRIATATHQDWPRSALVKCFRGPNDISVQEKVAITILVIDRWGHAGDGEHPVMIDIHAF